jgi:peroxiredoxin
MIKTIKKTKASFTLLYDENYQISEAFDVAYLPEKLFAKKLNPLSGSGLAKAQLDESERLPIPATFIIDPSGKIVWRHVDPNYKNRASAKEIADALNQF